MRSHSWIPSHYKAVQSFWLQGIVGTTLIRKTLTKTLTYGEGWHNNHYAYPNVAKAGWKWWEIDMTWWVIVSLRQMGLARRIVLPPTT
jgi:fatty-acid desaturase